MACRCAASTRRSPSWREMQRARGPIVAETLRAGSEPGGAGRHHAELDRAGRGVIRWQGAVPSFKGYLRLSGHDLRLGQRRDRAWHSGRARAARGDIVSIDCGAIWEGYQGDAAITVAVGEVPDEVQRLLDATRDGADGRYRGGQSWGAPGRCFLSPSSRRPRQAGCEVVREYGGHGIGSEMHEEPRIRNWGRPGRGSCLRQG